MKKNTLSKTMVIAVSFLMLLEAALNLPGMVNKVDAADFVLPYSESFNYAASTNLPDWAEYAVEGSGGTATCTATATADGKYAVTTGTVKGKSVSLFNLPQPNWTDYSITCSFSSSANFNTRSLILARVQDQDNFYYLSFKQGNQATGSNADQLQICKRTQGNSSAITSTPTDGSSGAIQLTNNTTYYAKFRLIGSTLEAYFSTTPTFSSTPTLTATDTELTYGTIGLGTQNTTSGAFTTTFDDISVTSEVIIPPVYNVNGYSNVSKTGTINILDPAYTTGSAFAINTNPVHGALSGTAVGSQYNWTYTPDTYYAGTDSFKIDVINGGSIVATTTVNITLINQLVIDNSNSGYSESNSTQWSTNQTGYANPGERVGNDHRTSNIAGAQAMWTPNLWVEGYYDVEFNKLYSSTSVNDPNAIVEIMHANGKDTQVVNLNQGPTGWFKLGTYHFSAGTSGYVRGTVMTQDKYFRADAVRFTLVSSPVIFFDAPFVEKQNGESFDDITGRGLQQGLNRCTVKATNTNTTLAVNPQATLFMALYDGTQLLDCAFSNPATLTTQNRVVPLTAQMDVPAVTPTMYLKVFIWDNMSSMIPYKAAKKINN